MFDLATIRKWWLTQQLSEKSVVYQLYIGSYRFLYYQFHTYQFFNYSLYFSNRNNHLCTIGRTKDGRSEQLYAHKNHAQNPRHLIVGSDNTPSYYFIPRVRLTSGTMWSPPTISMAIGARTGHPSKGAGRRCKWRHMDGDRRRMCPGNRRIGVDHDAPHHNGWNT